MGKVNSIGGYVEVTVRRNIGRGVICNISSTSNMTVREGIVEVLAVYGMSNIDESPRLQGLVEEYMRNYDVMYYTDLQDTWVEYWYTDNDEIGFLPIDIFANITVER